LQLEKFIDYKIVFRNHFAQAQETNIVCPIKRKKSALHRIFLDVVVKAEKAVAAEEKRHNN
jgi:hypothetical protein